MALFKVEPLEEGKRVTGQLGHVVKGWKEIFLQGEVVPPFRLGFELPTQGGVGWPMSFIISPSEISCGLYRVQIVALFLGYLLRIGSWDLGSYSNVGNCTSGWNSMAFPPPSPESFPRERKITVYLNAVDNDS